ncbi:MAG: DUF3244 domain-containing protein [Bacteroidaceae bacterium]|nr:DUF3244 domain-containing protein [Bacteroidaceae bacterium]
MSKKFILVYLLALLFCTNLNANIIIDDPIVKDSSNNNNGGRTISPSFDLTVNGDVLSIDINRYLGNAVVSVMAADGSSSISGTYYINGHDTVCLDFTGYSEGLYQMTITLGNGDVYLGSFRIE